MTTYLESLQRLGAEATDEQWSVDRAKVFAPDGTRIATTYDTFGGRSDARFIATARNCWEALVAVAVAAEDFEQMDMHTGGPDSCTNTCGLCDQETRKIASALSALKVAISGAAVEGEAKP